jgi:hypothetical protein
MSWVEDIIAMRALANGTESTPRRARWDFTDGVITDNAADGKKTIAIRPKVVGFSSVDVALTADVNNLNFSDAGLIRVNPDANGPWRITGLVAGQDRQRVVIANVDDAAAPGRPVILQFEGPGSTAANRIATPFDQLFIQQREVCELVYDITTQRWRPVTAVGPSFRRSARLTDANQTLSVATGVDYEQPFGTLTANRDKTLNISGVQTGQSVRIRRFDRSANQLGIIGDGGKINIGLETAIGEFTARFNGSDWELWGFQNYP